MGQRKQVKSKQRQKSVKKHNDGTPRTVLGPSRLILLRHGQSEAQATRTDPPDPLLTDLGSVQASAWRGNTGQFPVECVLISPLRRAVGDAGI